MRTPIHLRKFADLEIRNSGVQECGIRIHLGLQLNSRESNTRGVRSNPPVPPNYERFCKFFLPRDKMAFQGERLPGGLGMCNNVESMARVGSFCNYNPWGSSTPYSEHGLCRQTESHNGGAIAPQRNTEQAAIFSATNGTTRGECSQTPFQTMWAWQARQADIGGLRKQLEEEWRAEFEEQKRKHDLEIKRVEERLEREVGRGNRDRKSLEEKVKREQEYQKQLKEEARLKYISFHRFFRPIYTD